MTEADIAKTLLPCPFCGCQTPAFQSGISQYVNCPACYAEGPWNDDSEEEAITAWNTRVVDHPQATSPVDDRETPNMSDKQEIARLREALVEARDALSYQPVRNTRSEQALYTVRHALGDEA